MSWGAGRMRRSLWSEPSAGSWREFVSGGRAATRRGRLGQSSGRLGATGPVFIAIVLFAGSALLAGENRSSSPPQPLLEIAYDGASDFVWIHARHAPLREVLQELAREAELTIEWRDQDLVSGQVSIEVKGVSPEEALRRLLREFNSAFVYASRSATDPSAARLVKVVLLSRKGEPGAAGQAAVQQPRAGETPAAGEAQVEALVARIEGLERFQASEFATARRAVDALRVMAPGRLVDPLVNLVLQSSDPPLRVYAASMLGEIADVRAVEPLTWAFHNDGYPLARQTAMYSLLRIGGEAAFEPVFEAFKQGDLALQRAIAIAVASKGDENARRRVEWMIAEGQLPGELAAVWQFASRETK